MTGDGLYARAGRAVLFLGGKSGLVYGIRLIRLAILARLLTPEDFGIFGLAMVLYRGVQTFTTLGVEAYWIQRETLSPELIGTGWTLKLLRGVLLAGLIVLGAPFYARAVDAPGVEGVLVVTALAAVISGCVNPGRILSERNVRFGRIVANEVIHTLFEAGLVLFLAHRLRTPEALAWGLVGAAGFDVLLSFILFPFVARLHFDRPSLRELVGVGRHLLLIAIGTFITTQVDNLVAGVLLGTTAVGFYVMAYRLASLPMEMVFRVTNRVGVPALSRLQTNPQQLAKTFRSMLDLQLAALVPILVLFAGFAESLVRALYGEAWLEAVPVVRALGLMMVGRGLSFILDPYLVALGKFNVLARAKWIEVLVLVPALLLGGSTYGLVGLALAVGTSYGVAALLRMYFVQVYGVEKIHWLRRLFRDGLTVFPAFVGASWLGSAWTLSPMWRILSIVVVFTTLYAATLLVARRNLLRRVCNLLQQGWSSSMMKTRVVE